MLGFFWVGIATLFALYFYTLYFIYKPKAVDQNRPEYQQVYRFMDKNKRPLVIFLLMFLLVTFILLNEFEWQFVIIIGKGCCVLAVVGPLLHAYFGD